MLVNAALHFLSLEMERLAAETYFTALLEKTKHQPQKGERACYSAKEIA